MVMFLSRNSVCTYLSESQNAASITFLRDSWGLNYYIPGNRKCLKSIDAFLLSRS